MQTTDGAALVAIVGQGCVLPNAHDTAAYLNLLVTGDTRAIGTPSTWDAGQFLDPDRSAPDKGYTALGGYLEGYRLPAELGWADADTIDRHDRWVAGALHACRRTAPPEGRVGVFVGASAVSGPILCALLRDRACAELAALSGTDVEPLRATVGAALGIDSGASGSARGLPRILGDIVSRVLGQPVRPVVVDAACASSLLTLALGAEALQDGTVDIAYAGGVSGWGPLGMVGFCKLGGLSARGIFPFDRGADGTLFGEGAGFVALRRLDDALRDGQPILAVLRSIVGASDGRGRAIHAPNAAGQVRVLGRAYGDADLDPASVGLVIAHGTGTHVGDAVEVEGLRTFFGPRVPERGRIALVSNKALFGHLGWTAGIASVIHGTLALEHALFTPQAGLQELDPELGLADSPFRIPTRCEPWPRSAEPRRVGVSAFGFGGTNAHAVLEEWRGQRDARPPAPLRSGSPAFVGATARFPSAPDTGAVLALLDRGVPADVRVFPVRSEASAHRILPRMARAIDPVQLALLDAVGELVKQLGPRLDAVRDRTSVIVAHEGSLRRAIGVGLRTIRDALHSTVVAPGLVSEPCFERWSTDTRAATAAMTEDTFAGLMPNVLAGRVATTFDLRGTNFSLDSETPVASALELATRAIAAGRASLVLVAATASAATDDRSEGVVVFAVADPALGFDRLAPATLAVSDSEREAVARVFGDLGACGTALARLRAIARATREPAVRRHVAGWVAAPATRTAPRPYAIVSADSPERARTLTPDLPVLEDVPRVLDTDVLVHLDLASCGTGIPAGWDRLVRVVQAWQRGQDPDRRLSCVLEHAWAEGVWRPAVSLVRGLVSTVVQESSPATARGLAFDGPAIDLFARIAVEEASISLFGAWRDGVREVVSLTAAPPQQALYRLGTDDVVLAVGGHRGVTAEITRALVRDRGCTVVAVGRRPLAPDDALPLPEFADALRGAAARGISVAQARAEHFDLRDRRQASERFAPLLASGRVHYLPCDVTDPAQVRALVDRVRDRFGRLDAVVYGAVVGSQMGPFPGILAENVAHALNAKIHGVEVLLDALRGVPYARFLVLGSIAAYGAHGMVPYAAASAWQAARMVAENARTGSRRHGCIAWPVWRGTGLVARSGHLQARMEPGTGMSVVEPDAAACTVIDVLESDDADVCIAGDAERRGALRSVMSCAVGPLVDAIERQGTRLVATRTFEPERELWLADHRTEDAPVLAGTFLLELAAEAARAFDPSRVITGLREIRFHRWVKFHADRPLTLRAVAHEEGADVRVEIRSDFVSPKGVVLERDRLHATIRVLRGANHPVPPLVAPPSADGAVAAADPYTSAHAPVLLRGAFVTTRNHAIGRADAFADVRLDLRGELPVRQFVLPALALDGALRCAALRPVQGRWLPVYAPLEIREIDFFSDRNDGALDGARVWHDADATTWLFAPDGTLVFRARGAAARAIGYVAADTGESVDTLPSEHTFVHRVDPATHPHLSTAARLEGVPVLPGSFELALAARAARDLCPGQWPVELSDVRFLSVCRLTSALDVNVHARRTAEDRVEVRIGSRFVHRSGRTLGAERIHATLVVRLAPYHPPAPAPMAFDSAHAVAEPHVPGAVYRPESHLCLGEGFRSVGDTRRDGDVRRSVYQNATPVPPEVYGGDFFPPLLGDALLQNALLVDGEWASTAIPRSIARVCLYRRLDDVDIVSHWPRLALLTRLAPDRGAHHQAVTPEGEVLMEAFDFLYDLLGAIHLVTGERRAATPSTDTSDLPPIPEILAGGRVVRHRALSSERDGWMTRAHLAGDQPSLPGFYELDLALDTVLGLFPGWVPAVLRRITYHRFVKVPATGLDLRIVVSRRDDAASPGDVQVVLMSDFVHADGRILQRDRVHWEATVELRRALPPGPSSGLSFPEDGIPVPVAHYLAGAPIFYTPELRTIGRRVQTPDGVAWAATAEVAPPELAALRVPLAAADVMGLTPIWRDGDTHGVHVMRDMRELRLYGDVWSGQRPRSLFSRADPMIRDGDGLLGCSRIAVFHEDGTLLGEGRDARFLVLGGVQEPSTSTVRPPVRTSTPDTRPAG